MDASGGAVRRKRQHGPQFGEAPTEKVQTLADEQIKNLLDKQLCKETSISTELGRKQNVCQAIVAKDESSASTGFRTLEEYQSIIKRENHITSLREHGLTEKEIDTKLNFEKFGEDYVVSGGKKITDCLESIQNKIRKHELELSKPNQFSETINVTRRVLETEQASKSNNDHQNYSFLLKLKEKGCSSKDPVTATLKEHGCLKDIDITKEMESDEDVDETNDFIGPILCNINERVEIIQEEVILKNRLSLKDIHGLERFKDYKAGEPNNVLYVKNLSKSTTEKDLAKLFARYYRKGTSNVEYRIMKGRMHGQAFITFKNQEIATEALLFNNGYKIDDKPVIISYSQRK